MPAYQTCKESGLLQRATCLARCRRTSAHIVNIPMPAKASAPGSGTDEAAERASGEGAGVERNVRSPSLSVPEPGRIVTTLPTPIESDDCSIKPVVNVLPDSTMVLPSPAKKPISW